MSRRCGAFHVASQRSVRGVAPVPVRASVLGAAAVGEREKLVDFMRLLCRFHLHVSTNSYATDKTLKLLKCLSMKGVVRRSRP